MNNRKLKKIIFLFSLIWLMLFSTIAAAEYFAYVPDQAGDEDSKYLHIINTKYDILADSVLLLGSPRDVVVSHRGNYVFVSTVITDSTGSSSKLNIVSTKENQALPPKTINKRYVRGLTLTKDDASLYITHEGGITKIVNPTFSSLQTELSLEYSGISMVLSDDEKYLFVIGIDGGNNDGISVVDVSQETMREVAAYDLGADVGVNSIIFDNSTNELFVLTQVNAELINLRINNYDVAENISLDQIAVKKFETDSYPIDIAMNSDNTEIYVALSYLYDGVGYGDGYITVLNPTDLNGTAVYDRISLSKEGGEFNPQPGDKGGFGAIHPLSIAFDDSTPGRLHVVKQIWNEYAGTYVSSIDDIRSRRDPNFRKFEEVKSVHLGKRSSTQLTGKFIGPECSFCPSGLENDAETIVRPSAINPFMLLFALIILIPLRLLQLKLKLKARK